VRRARRTEARRERGALRLTPRDIEVLEATGRMRYVTTPQLARLLFGGSQWAARKRLRRLFDAGCLRCWSPRLEAPNVYALTLRGARLLGHPDPHGEPWPAPRGLDRRLEHLLAVNSLRVALATTLESESAVIEWWQSDVELLRLFRECVVPDALFRIGWPDTSNVYALEVDRTPPAPQAFARKLLRYQSLRSQAFGAGAFTLLVVGGKPAWVERARDHARKLGRSVPVWFGVFEDIDSHGAYGSWRSLHDNCHPSLRSVASAERVRQAELPETPSLRAGAQAREPRG